MDNYKVGQRVIITRRYNGRMDGTCAQNSIMYQKFAGEVVTISKVFQTGRYFRYHIKESKKHWDWTNAMIKGPACHFESFGLKLTNLPSI